MSEETPALTIANTQPVQPSAAVTNKIFLSGLGTSDDPKEDIRQLFSGYGDVVEVVVDGSYATVTFTEERVVQVMEQLGEIMLNSTKLYISRILEEHKVSPGNDSPFYQAGIIPAPFHQLQPAEHLLRSSYPAYQPQPAYPVWYQPTQPPPPSPFYQPTMSDCGPVQSLSQQYQPASLSGASTATSVPPITSVVKTSAHEQNVFNFDMISTQQQQMYQHTQFNHTRSTTGCCHVCSSPSPAVQGLAPLAAAHPQYPGHGTQSYFGHSPGHQLQPLTPITPSLPTGYLLPPTPTPVNLPPMTPTYYLPPSPAPTSLYYSPYNSLGHIGGIPPYTTMIPQPYNYTNLKSSDNGLTQEDTQTFQQNVAYFTSPFKRFSKFRGTPTPAGFPLKSSSVPQGFKGRGGGDGSSWYQQGDRWGQRSGGEGEQGKEDTVEAPDILINC